MEKEICEKCRPLFEELKKRIEELEEKIYNKPKPDFIKDPVEIKPKKTGQKKGYEGCSRKIPEKIDRIVEY